MRIALQKVTAAQIIFKIQKLALVEYREGGLFCGNLSIV
jgi:hypothetical protein